MMFITMKAEVLTYRTTKRYFIWKTYEVIKSIKHHTQVKPLTSGIKPHNDHHYQFDIPPFNHCSVMHKNV